MRYTLNILLEGGLMLTAKSYPTRKEAEQAVRAFAMLKPQSIVLSAIESEEVYDLAGDKQASASLRSSDDLVNLNLPPGFALFLNTEGLDK